MSITSNANSTFLNVDNAHLRVSGDIHATAVKVGAIEIVPGYSLESTTGIGNTTPHTIEFTNTETSLVTSGDINMLHSSNNATIKLNSNVVTEFPRSKKLIKYPRVNLTQNALDNGYAATASSENNGTSSGQAYRAFDGNAGGERGYHSAASTYSSGSYAGSASITDAHGTQHQGEWIKLQMPTTEKMKLSGFSFSPRYVSTAEYQHRAPYKGVFLGSTDGTNWYPIHYFDNVAVPELTTVSKTFENNTNNYYNHIALVAYEIGPNATYGDVLNFAEMELFGVPEYDPDADGVDVKVKSVPNVPNTDWLEVYYDAKDLADGAVTSVDDLTPSGTNDGTATNVTVSDGAFVFNGTDSKITTGTTLSDGAYPHSICLWYYTNDNPSTLADYLFQLGDNTENNSPNININGATFYLSFYGNYLYTPVTNTGIQQKKWVQISYSYDGGATTSNNPAVYIDGKQIPMTGPLGNSAGSALSLVLGTDPNLHLTIGSRRNDTLPVNGKIANFRLFNRALTSDEVWQLYAYQKEYFGHGDLSMTLKAGRLGIGTSEPKAALDVRGDVRFYNVPHIYATDDGGYDAANEAYINFDRVESSYGIALVGTNGTFKITEQAGAGVYYVDGSVSFHQSTGTEVRNLELIIHLNGVSHHSNNRNYGLTAMKHVTGSTYSDLGVTALVKCNVGDEIRLYGKSRSSSINVHTPNNKMVIFKVQST